jgi:hypothetical protein
MRYLLVYLCDLKEFILSPGAEDPKAAIGKIYVGNEKNRRG